MKNKKMIGKIQGFELFHKFSELQIHKIRESIRTQK